MVQTPQSAIRFNAFTADEEKRFNPMMSESLVWGFPDTFNPQRREQVIRRALIPLSEIVRMLDIS
jgi:hypothetical protein